MYIILHNDAFISGFTMQERLVHSPALQLMGVAGWQTGFVDSCDHREDDVLRRLCLQHGLLEKQSHAMGISIRDSSHCKRAYYLLFWIHRLEGTRMGLSAFATTFAASSGDFVFRTIGEVSRVGMRCGSEAASQRGRHGVGDMVDEGDLTKKITLHYGAFVCCEIWLNRQFSSGRRLYIAR